MRVVISGGVGVGVGVGVGIGVGIGVDLELVQYVSVQSCRAAAPPRKCCRIRRQSASRAPPLSPCLNAAAASPA